LLLLLLVVVVSCILVLVSSSSKPKDMVQTKLKLVAGLGACARWLGCTVVPQVGP
jgi:hypothetical protein